MSMTSDGLLKKRGSHLKNGFLAKNPDFWKKHFLPITMFRPSAWKVVKTKNTFKFKKKKLKKKLLDLWPILRFWPYFEVQLRCKPGSFFWSFLGHFVSFRVILGHFGSSWVILGHLGTFGVIFGPHWAIWGHWQKLTGPMCSFLQGFDGDFFAGRPLIFLAGHRLRKTHQIVRRPQDFDLVSRAVWARELVSTNNITEFCKESLRVDEMQTP